MSTIRHRLSQLIGFSEDSTADSDASTRAQRSLNTPSESDTDNSASTGRNRGNSLFSAASECLSTVASSLEETSPLTPKPHNPNSPGKLKKAVSTTFETLSNSLRSRTHLFYPATEIDQPKTPPSEESCAHDNLHGGKLWSPGKKGASRSPRKALKNIFTSPGGSISGDRTSLRHCPSRDISPSPTRRSLWSSIKERAGRDHHITDGFVWPEPDSQTSPQSLVDNSAPSLDVDIPNCSLTVSQLPEGTRLRALRNSSSRPSTPTQLSDSSRPTSSQDGPLPSTPLTTLDRPHVRFLELTPKSHVAVAQSVRRSSPNPFFTNGNSSIKHGTGIIGHGGASQQGDEPAASQESPTASPNTPNMGPKSVWDQARADRESRYRALTDPETDPGLELEGSGAKEIEHPLDQPDSMKLKSSPQISKIPQGELRYAVEAIDRSPGETSDVSDLSRTKASSYIPGFSGDLHYDVEAIERSPGTLYDGASSSSSTMSDKPQSEPESSGPDVRYAIQAMQGMFGTNVNYSRSRISFAADDVDSVHNDYTMNTTYDSEGSDNFISLSRPPTPPSCIGGSPQLSPLVPSPYPAPHALQPLVEANKVVTAKNRDFTAAVDDATLISGRADKAGAGSQALESDNGFDRQPVTVVVIDSDENIKPSAQPLTSDNDCIAMEEYLKLTPQALLRGKEQTLTPAKVPLPPSPYPASHEDDLPVRLRSQLNDSVLDYQNQNGPENVHNVESGFTAPSAPGSTEPSTKTSKKKKKKSPKRKKSLKKLPPSKKSSCGLVEVSGNAEKEYSYSQIVNGDRQIDTLKEGIKEANVEAKADAPEAAEHHCRSSSQKKGVWWAREDEIIGEPESPSPTIERAAPLSSLKELQEEQELAYNNDTDGGSAISRDTETEAQHSCAGGLWDEQAKAAVAEHLRKVVEGIFKTLNKENKAERD